MAIKYLDSKRIRGLSSDTKPTNVPANTRFEETDTKAYYWFQSSAWGRGFMNNYGYCHGTSTAGYRDVSDRFPFSTDADALDVGNLHGGGWEMGGTSDPVGGYSYLHGGGIVGGYYDFIQRIAQAASATGTNVGTASGMTVRIVYSFESSTHGYWAGGYNAGTNDRIGKYSFASSANGEDVADLTVARHRGGNCTSDTYGYCHGGHQNGTSYDVIDKHHISIGSNSSDVGNLLTAEYQTNGTEDKIGGYGYAHGGNTDITRIQRYSMAVDENSVDVGNMALNGGFTSACPSSYSAGYIANPNGCQKHTFSSAVTCTDVLDLSYNREAAVGTQG